MTGHNENIDERTRLLPAHTSSSSETSRGLEHQEPVLDSEDSTLQDDNLVAERLPYNDYTTIDYLREVVKDSSRYRSKHSKRGIRSACLSAFDSCQGWIVAALTGVITACVAAFVDVAVATVSDWKFGYCMSNILSTREHCCARPTALDAVNPLDNTCAQWHHWSDNYWKTFGIYVAWALLFGLISGGVTMLSKKNLPAATPTYPHQQPILKNSSTPQASGKVMYLSAGSGIPEIKSVLAGFTIPHLFDLKVLFLKAIGAIFAVPTGMNLGKEGPFVHISTCVAHFMATRFRKYRENAGQLREMIAAGCASGLSVAFGAPVGGVLFAYEEISSYFPRKVLLRSFTCSLCAAIVLRELNPNGTGRLMMYQTNYGTTYKPVHYAVFVLLGVGGGIFGGILCKANFFWSKTFRKQAIIKNHPVFEVFLVVLVTALLQFSNPLTRDPGDIGLSNLLVDCDSPIDQHFVCIQEAAIKNGTSSFGYFGHLIHGLVVKLVLTIITFGTKVPGGVIIPALDGGAFFGRLVGQFPVLADTLSPGIFAMVGAGAFLAGVSRMTISLAVIMSELTGEIEFMVPNMIGIMVAKLVADQIERDGIYELAQRGFLHPFLDLDHSMKLVQRDEHLVTELNPPHNTMHQITVEIPPSGCARKDILLEKLEQLKERGLMDAGLVLVHADHDNVLAGLVRQADLDFALTHVAADHPDDGFVQLLLSEPSVVPLTPDAPAQLQQALDLSAFVDRTPLTVCQSAPMEYALEMFSKMGLSHLITTEMGTNRVTGVIIKKRLVAWLDKLKDEHK